ncbi:MAG: kynurenine 3-monooxygenase [Bradymonadia bacterium]|jgi:kynurenine 3-monooxygenase
MSDARVAVAGAGLAGSLLAIYMARRGLPVTIYERRPDMRKVEVPAGRSINLALSTRGIAALEGVGLADEVLRMAIPMRGRMMHSVDGVQTYQPYGRDGEAINSVSRRALNELLMSTAETEGVQIEFNQQVRDVDVRDATLTLESDGVKREVQTRFVVGADGAFSAVRARMMRRGRFNYSQTYLEHGYKELTMPPAEDGGFRLDPNALHIWPRHDFMMIALPNPDHTFTCTLFLRHERAEFSFESLQDDESVRGFFDEHFSDAVPHLSNLCEEFAENPIGALSYVKCGPYNHGERTLLIGDAAHAIVPFYGQGMNAAFEDCRLFDQLVGRHGPESVSDAIHEFSDTRKDDADAICDLAVYNFYVMRDYVADPAFLARKQLEHVLEDAFPETYRSLYGMVSFSNIPYAEAKSIADKQTAWLDLVGESGGTELLGLLMFAWIRHIAKA